MEDKNCIKTIIITQSAGQKEANLCDVIINGELYYSDSVLIKSYDNQIIKLNELQLIYDEKTLFQNIDDEDGGSDKFDDVPF
jgi:putative NIF3 family GTP cyclohydrolase 1 type 2